MLEPRAAKELFKNSKNRQSRDSKITKLFSNSSLKGKIHKFNKSNELFPYWQITFIRELKWRYILFRDFPAMIEYVRGQLSGQWLRKTDWTQFHETSERSRAWNKTDPFPGRWGLTIRIGIFERALERSNLYSFWSTVDPVDKISNRFRYYRVSFKLCHDQVTTCD